MGSYCPIGTTTPLPCTAGSYTDQTGRTFRCSKSCVLVIIEKILNILTIDREVFIVVVEGWLTG